MELVWFRPPQRGTEADHLVYSEMKGKIRVRYIVTAFLFTGAVLAALFSNRRNQKEIQKREETIVLRYGDVNPEGNITVRSAHYFAEQVNELSGGRIEIDLYPSGVLGDDSKCYQQVRMGALDFYRANGGSLDSIGDVKVSLLALPYLFRDREHFWNVCSGPLGRALLEDLRSSGSQMVGIFYIDEGVRNLFTSDRPVKRLSDLQGMRIRVMESDILADTIRAFGAEPIASSYAELYNTLQEKEVDGADNPVTSYYSNKFYKVAPYYIRTEHMYSPSVVVMSEITWDHLSQEDRNIILEAAVRTEKYNQSEIRKAEDAAYSQLSGVTVLEPEEPEEWRNAVSGVCEKYGKGNEELIREIRETR